MTNKDQDLIEILKKMDELLRQARELADPILERWQKEELTPTYPGVVGHCFKCGLELRQVMGYVCSNPNCPTGLGPTIS